MRTSIRTESRIYRSYVILILLFLLGLILLPLIIVSLVEIFNVKDKVNDDIKKDICFFTKYFYPSLHTQCLEFFFKEKQEDHKNNNDGTLIGVNNWLTWGQNYDNTHNNRFEKKFNINNAHLIKVHCTFEPLAEVSGYITSAGDDLGYFTTWGGTLLCIKISTCKLVWNRTISSYTNKNNDLSRSAPAIDGPYIYIASLLFPSSGCIWLKINRFNGDLIWKTDYNSVDNHPFCIVTNSPIVYKDFLLAGTSSAEELAAALIPGYNCCTSKGHIVAIDKNNGNLIWKTTTVRMLNSTGYAGNAVWGSQFSINQQDNTLYVGTGNNYAYPPDIQACLNSSLNNFTLCVNLNGNLFDSLLQLDIFTGTIKWFKTLVGYDAFNLACKITFINPSNCPLSPGPDWDFGQSPMRWTDVYGRRLIGAGQKSGIFWALDEYTGNIIWSNQICPPGNLGGMEWGSALDDTGIYVACANAQRHKYLLLNNEIICGGLWAKIDRNTGVAIWTTADPSSPIGNASCDSYRDELDLPPEQGPLNYTGPLDDNNPSLNPLTPLIVKSPVFSSALGPLSVSNKLLYAGSMTGGFYIINTENGQILNSFDLIGSVNSAPAIVEGKIIIGSGYSKLGAGLGGGKIFVFDLN